MNDKKEKAITEYKEINFYIAGNEERYIQYSALNPDMNADEIVWRVNNNLDKEKYKFISEVSNGDDICVIVNKYFKLPDSYCPPDLVESDGLLMRKEVVENFSKMHDAARKEGYFLKITSAYRSIEEQRNVYEDRISKDKVEVVDETCARPGHSEHHTGLAIDVEWPVPEGMELSETPETAWVRENGPHFGFIVRYLPETVEITGYASEPWHMRYVGVQVSTDMKEKNINSFEEYSARFLVSTKK